MWFSISWFLLFVLLKPVSIISKETIIIRTSEELNQNAFVDILKNITSANQILQELIKNYKQLNKIYKSEESLNAENEDERGNFKALSSEDDHTTKGYGVTQMIYMGETEESIEENPSGNKKKDNNVDKDITKELKLFLNESDMVSASDHEEIEGFLQKTPILNIEKNINNKNKTRFSIKHKGAKRHFDRPNLRQRDVKTNKRIVYAEVFSPDKIWNEVINKPIELKIYNDRANFRNSYNKVVISGKTTKSFDNEKDLSDSQDSNPDEDVIKKEEYKTVLLREAYGDACLQVTVKKCYKALKAVRKAVCRLRFKCKSSLKGSFIANAKKGCIREFVNGKNKSKDNDAEAIIFERTINKSSDMSKYVDLCLPHLRSEKISKEIPTSANEFKSINILRDKFEKACKKLSAKKCRNACNFAYKTACSIHSCENSLKNGFKKSCKAECKAAYNLYKASSYSDDDDESDSGSD